MRKIIVTPISILLIIAFILSALTAMNGLFINSGGGNSLGGGFALFITLIISGLFAVEQAVVKNLKRKRKSVWIGEFLLVAVIAVILLLSNFEFSIG